MKTQTKQLGTLALMMGFVLFTGFSNKTTPERVRWEAPSTANALKNPLKGNEAATAKGKKLYKQMCAICHGAKGQGDGAAGASLNPRPSDFTMEIVQKQSDGAIFWKITEGKAPMASYENILSETQRWQLVNFIKTF